MKAPNHLDAGEALRRMRDGSLTCQALMESTLAEIRRREPELKAWVVLDEKRAMDLATQADAVAQPQRGALHGLPLAVKDTYDTFDFPTEWGGKAWKGRRPDKDARMVATARKAGAIVIGKTVTTEYALLHPGVTRNPHNPRHTPGGSSSGSAAALAAFMAPLGFGSQTNGSMLRPASYCGVYGIKPTYGLLPRTGLQPIASAVDTPGLFSRDLEGMAIALEVLVGPDPDDADSLGEQIGGLAQAVTSGPMRRWKVGFSRTPVWGRCDDDARRCMESFALRLKAHADVVDLELPAGFEKLHENHMALQDSGVARHLYENASRNPENFSASLLENIRRGHAIPESRVDEARQFQVWARAAMDKVFDNVDVIIGLAATGEAPATLSMTGDPVMQTIWTFTGTPALSVPALTGSSGLPIGVQVTAKRRRDADVLGFAAFLEASKLVARK